MGFCSTPFTLKITVITPRPVTSARIPMVSPSAMARLAPETVDGRDARVSELISVTLAAGLVITTPSAVDLVTFKVIDLETSLPPVSLAVALISKERILAGIVTSTWYGASVTGARSVPPTLKVTDSMPRWSWAVAVIVTTDFAETESPSAGEVIVITGAKSGMGSGGLGGCKQASVSFFFSSAFRSPILVTWRPRMPTAHSNTPVPIMPSLILISSLATRSSCRVSTLLRTNWLKPASTLSAV